MAVKLVLLLSMEHSDIRHASSWPWCGRYRSTSKLMRVTSICPRKSARRYTDGRVYRRSSWLSSRPVSNADRLLTRERRSPRNICRQLNTCQTIHRQHTTPHSWHWQTSYKHRARILRSDRLALTPVNTVQIIHHVQIRDHVPVSITKNIERRKFTYGNLTSTLSSSSSSSFIGSKRTVQM